MWNSSSLLGVFCCCRLRFLSLLLVSLLVVVVVLCGQIGRSVDRSVRSVYRFIVQYAYSVTHHPIVVLCLYEMGGTYNPTYNGSLSSVVDVDTDNIPNVGNEGLTIRKKGLPPNRTTLNCTRFHPEFQTELSHS